MVNGQVIVICGRIKLDPLETTLQMKIKQHFITSKAQNSVSADYFP
jgi:hypothetical protein